MIFFFFFPKCVESFWPEYSLSALCSWLNLKCGFMCLRHLPTDIPKVWTNLSLFIARNHSTTIKPQWLRWQHSLIWWKSFLNILFHFASKYFRKFNVNFQGAPSDFREISLLRKHVTVWSNQSLQPVRAWLIIIIIMVTVQIRKEQYPKREKRTEWKYNKSWAFHHHRHYHHHHHYHGEWNMSI